MLNSKKRLTRLLAGAGVLALLSGCATTTDGTSYNAIDDTRLMFTSTDDMSKDERVLVEEAKRHAGTRIAGGATGAAFGCVGGFIAGTQLGNSNEAKLAGTAIGCVSGAFLGYAAGNYISEVNKSAASAETNLQARVMAAEGDIKRYQVAADAATRAVADLKKDINSLNTRFAAGQATAKSYAEESKRLDVSARSLRALIVESQGNIQAMEKDIAALEENGKKVGNLKVEMAKLQKENERLVASYQELVAVAETMPEGSGAPDLSVS